MTKQEQIRVKIERARISDADGMDRDAFMHLLEAVAMIATALQTDTFKAACPSGQHAAGTCVCTPRSTAPSCARCENDEHDKCGGPESGCGCAYENHGEPIQLRPADPPLPSGPPEVRLSSISKDELCARIAKVIGRTSADVGTDLQALISAAATVASYGDMAAICKLAEAALRLAGVIR